MATKTRLRPTRVVSSPKSGAALVFVGVGIGALLALLFMFSGVASFNQIDTLGDLALALHLLPQQATSSINTATLVTTTKTTRELSAWDDDNIDEQWKPLDCRSFLSQRVFSDNPSTQDPNQGKFFARWTKTSHPFWIVLHNETVDCIRWGTMEYGLYYERSLTIIFEEILRNALPNARVIDVGGNIGWFSFLSASMQHHVDVFEPLDINLIRQCQAMHLNNWDTAPESEINNRTTKRSSINIRRFGILDKVDTTGARMAHDPSNPGSATIVRNNELLVGKTDIGHLVPMTTLDHMANDLGWLYNRNDHGSYNTNNNHNNKPIIAILKIDIEGAEVSAIKGARRLLQSGLVQNILIEVTMAYGYPSRHNTTVPSQQQLLSPMKPGIQMLESILDLGYRLHQWGGYRGPDKKLPPEYPVSGNSATQARYMATAFPPSVRHHQLNLWFQHRTLLSKALA